jgi:hypothetical protein
MRVLVMYAIVGDDLDVVITFRTPISRFTLVSRVIRIEGAAAGCNGNPYLVFGEAVSKFTGYRALDCSIDVFGCTSGNLSSWK